MEKVLINFRIARTNWHESRLKNHEMPLIKKTSGLPANFKRKRDVQGKDVGV